MNDPDPSADPGQPFVATLRAAAPYVHAHRERVFVVAIDGEAIAGGGFERLCHDIALLHSLGVRLVLVHGARPQIDAGIRAAGGTPILHGDHRVTDDLALGCVKAAVGSVRLEIEARLSTSLASTPMGGARLRVASGNWITARPVGVRDGVDLQHTGELRRVAHQSIAEELAAGRLALISPVGYSPTGEIFNLRAEDVATAVAGEIGADKLILVTPGQPRDLALAAEAGDAGQLSLAAARAALQRGTLGDDDRRFLSAAVAAADRGVQRVHLVSDRVDGALLRELYTHDGCGLLIYADDGYEGTRAASIDDVGGILQLIQPLEAEGILVPRSREQLELDIGQFQVMVRDGLVVACHALFPLPGDESAEFACIAVHPDYRRAGRAARMLAEAEARARQLGIRCLYTLTTHTPHWFIEHGFERVDPEALPVARRALYNYQRNSLVLRKQIA